MRLLFFVGGPPTFFYFANAKGGPPGHLVRILTRPDTFYLRGFADSLTFFCVVFAYLSSMS